MKLSRQSLIGIAIISIFLTLIVMMVILTAAEYSGNDLHYRIAVNAPLDNSTDNSTPVVAPPALPQ